MRWPLYRAAVAENSMTPALRPGDWLLAWRGLRPDRPVKIKPGQIVIARHPADAATFLVKRVAWREPAGWWLASDNAAAGAVDSARFGPVAPELIEARVVGRYWPARSRRART
jgi:signal peptidase I